MSDKGHCKHGEFLLSEGCPQCVEEQREQSTGNAPPFQATTTDSLEQPSPLRIVQSVAAGEIGETITISNELLEATAIALRPGEDVEVRGYYHESMKLLEYAEQRVIKTVDDTKTATNDLSIISKLKKLMVDKRVEMLEPHVKAADDIRATYNFLMSPILEADKITRKKMLDFDTEQKRIRAEQEAINQQKLEVAERQKKLTGELIETNLVEVQPEISSTTRAEMGMAGQRDNWKWEIIDPLLIPREYLVVDNAQLTAIARRHHDKKPIPGVRFFNEPIIAVRAK